MTIFLLARPLRWAIHLVVLSALLMIPLGVPSPDRTSGTVGSLAAFSDKIDPAVLATAAKSPDGQAYALIFFKEQADLSFARHMDDWNARGWAVYRALKDVADRAQKDVLAGLAARKANGLVADYHSYWIVNLVTVRADADTLRWLAARPEVAYIYPELKIEAPKPLPASARPDTPGTIEWNITKINAPEVWTTYNVTGTGAVVANVDTGVQYDHPALVNQYRGNLGGGNFDHNYNWWDPTHVYTYPFPIEDGHGTHVMGTEVGDDGAGNQIGVAPGAKWIAAYGCCPDNDALLSAEQFMIAPTDLNGNNPDPSKRPNAVNNSWSGPGGSLIFNGLIEAQRAAGVFPAYAAANSGPACGTMGSPGDNPAVGLSVGATDSNDNIATFSSRGSNPFGGIGPDVSAPGVSVRSAWPTDTYAVLSGTSMATPHVAGSVALIISAEPTMAGKVDQLEELLRRTSVGLTSSQTCGGVPGSQVPNNTYGWGRIDLKAAVDMVWHAGTLSGQVTDSGQPVAGATVSISRQLASGRTITLTQTTDASGNYSFVAGEGTYTVRVDAYGYNSMTTTNVTVAWGQATTQVFSLTALPVYTVSGQVGDGTLPIYLAAKVEALNVPGAVAITNPTDGQYSLALAQGTYTLRASSEPGYAPMTQVITVTGNLTGVNFGLTPRYDYAWSDSRQPGGPTYEWIDITGTGTVWNAPDDGQLSVSIPSGFTYYGTNYTTLYINSNGWVGFSPISPPSFIGGGNKMIPFEGPPNNAIYGLSEDLNANNGSQGQIYYQYLSDQNLYVVEYYQVQHWASGFPETFEIILNQTDDTIKVQYETVSWPDFTTVGVESSDGSYATVYSYANSANLEAGRAVLFTPKRGTLMNSLYLPIALQ